MKKSDIFLMALKNLKDRMTRTKLTVTGVVIGTCAIVIMMSIGIGIDKMMTRQYEQNSNLQKITVFAPGGDYYVEDEEKNNSNLPFDDSTVENFKKISPHIKTVVPSILLQGSAKITRGRYTFSGDIIATDLSAMEGVGYELKSGSFSDIDKASTVFFGSQGAANFYDNQGNPARYKYDSKGDIVQSDVNLMSDSFTLSPCIPENDDGSSIVSESDLRKSRLKTAGILKDNYSIDGSSGYSAYIDISLAKQLLLQYQKLNKNHEEFKYSKMTVLVDNMKNVQTVKKALEDYGYNCYSDDEDLEYAKKQMLVVQLVLGAIGAISMFVAAFGISNTMVMSVYERTKEIGVMKVLGCELKDIKAIFLYEAGCIGLIGGAIGLAVSYIVSLIANLIARQIVLSQSGGEDIYVCVSSIPVWLAAAGIAFSVLIGIIAGLSPAKRAVKTSALSAIHNE